MYAADLEWSCSVRCSCPAFVTCSIPKPTADFFINPMFVRSMVFVAVGSPAALGFEQFGSQSIAMSSIFNGSTHVLRLFF